MFFWAVVGKLTAAFSLSMNNLPLTNATRRIGPPKDWDHERDGICHTIEVFDSADGYMVTAWQLTEPEKVRLVNGEPLFLSIAGSVHPVISLSIGSKGK